MHRTERIALWIALIAFAIGSPSSASGCSCVPEKLCHAPDVDLRLVAFADEDCPRGSICCNVEPGGPSAASEELFCDGECVPISEQSASEEYDEYGTDLIDVRLVSTDQCPTGYTCRSLRPAVQVPVCGGTCVPRTMCTMFEQTKQNDGCAEGNVCCGMNRVAWTGLINDINGMGWDHSSAMPPEAPACELPTESNGERIPPWLVSIWAQVEVIPGFTTDQFACAGVLLDRAYVLTLASCVGPVASKDLFVNIGDYDITNKSSIRMGNIYTIQEKIIHEDYNATNLLHRNVALLQLTGGTRIGTYAAPLRSSSNEHHRGRISCLIVGWDREALVARKVGRARAYETTVETFNEDLFCAPGTICLHDTGTGCEGSSLNSSPVICTDRNGSQADDWLLEGLLVGNCSGIAMTELTSWVQHLQEPGFVQVSQPNDESRKYLPPI